VKTKKLLYLAMAVYLVLSTVLGGCAPAATPTPAPVAKATSVPQEPTKAPEAKLTFALITKTLNNPFWDMMHEGTRAWCDEQGYDLIYLAPTKPNNLEEQNRLMDDVIAKQVDGIVLCPVDSAGVVPAIDRATAAGIPVSVAATGATGGDFVTYSGTDNYEGMKMVAEYVAEALNYKGKVIVLDGLLGASVGQDRRRGVDDTLAKYPDIEILGRQDAEMQRAKGMQVMENLLQTHPELDAVLAANDEEALGAIEALDAAGLLDSTLRRERRGAEGCARWPHVGHPGADAGEDGNRWDQSDSGRQGRKGRAEAAGDGDGPGHEEHMAAVRRPHHSVVSLRG